jgi:hypothetical protein
MGPIDVYLVRYCCLFFEAEISASAGLLPIYLAPVIIVDLRSLNVFGSFFFF